MNSIRCSQVHNVNASFQCSFVKSNDDCQDVEGFLNYINFVYCDFESILVPVLISVVWLICLFVTLGTTADDYFSPCLEVISKVLKLSHNVAGVTFLAFGNGAPDIFSSIAGTNHMRPELVIGALFGAGIFVTCVVVGVIILWVPPFKMVERPFLRDVTFYLAAAFWAFYLFYTRRVTFFHSIGFIVLYVVYMFVVLVSHYIYQKYLKPRNRQTLVPSITITPYDGFVNDTMEADYNIADEIIPWGAPPIARRWSTEIPNDQSALSSLVSCHERTPSVVSETTPLLGVPLVVFASPPSRNFIASFFRHICPIDCTQWHKLRWWSKLTTLLKAPLVLSLNLTIPVVNYDKELNHWNRSLAVFHCLFSPVLFTFAIDYSDLSVGGKLPLWSIMLMGGSLIGGIVWLTSDDQEPPRYHSVFALFGFAMSVVWIYLLANEIVSVLKMIGIVCHLSDAILGMTLLAWGNSLSDLIADIAIAKQGHPVMAISACFGGPLFNLLLGIGIPFTLATVKQKNYSIKVPYDKAMTLLSAFLCASLLSALIMVLTMKFQMNRFYGAYLVLLYVTFLIVSILNEKNII